MTKPLAPNPQSQIEDKDEIDLREVFGTLWRGKLLIILCAVIGILLSGYYAFVAATPVYTATSSVALESRQEQIVDFESVMGGLGGDQQTVNTEVEVFKSRQLIGRLVDDLNLVNDPEFNPELRPEPNFSLGKAIGWVLDLVRGPREDLPPPTETQIRDEAVTRVLERVSISNIRQSYVFQVTATTQQPEKSSLMANHLAELYIQNQVEVKFERTERATVWLTERVSELRIELEEAETALKAFSSSTDLISPEGLFALNRQVKELRDRRDELAKTVGEAEAEVASLQANASASREQRAALTADPVLTALMTRITEGDAAAEAEFDARYQQLVMRAQQNEARTQQQFTALDSSIKDLTGRIERQSAELVSLQQYQREAEASRLIYEHFLGRLKETSVQQGIQQADSRLLSHAVVPENPSAPRKGRILALGMIMGLIVGAGTVLAREAAQNTFRISEDLEKIAGLPVIGQIPTIPARRRKNVLKYLSDKPASAAAEAVRNLRTSVLLANLDNPPKVIMSTSSIPGEGKTTQSLAMAQNLAGLGKRVLLIEGDIRKRVFSEYFEIDSEKGLLAVLSGEATLEEAAVYNEQLKADVLIGEKSKINAADVFSSETFVRFLNAARAAYDYVIIDTPPVLAVPDARVIGGSVDAIIYAVKWDSTTRRQVAEGLRSFANVNVRVSGLVLTQIDKRGMKRYGYGDSYGSYSNYYHE
ncbi:GumC family protein [Pseudooceanicola sp.]|uniref:GumC family protein n=1 Tax=Pseudooceanicola sp. TaxID=1914328 RepID=UPI0035C6A790